MIRTMQDRQPGVVATGITGALTLTKSGSTARTATFPDASIVVAGSASALTSGLIPQAGSGGILADSALGTSGITGTLTLTKSGTTARTATFPDAAITVAGINLAQTWSAAQNFNSGTTVIATADINGGAIDGTTIGASSASTIKATTIVTSSNVAVGFAGPAARPLDVFGSAQFKDASNIATTIWSEAVTGAGGLGTNSNHPFVVVVNGSEVARWGTGGLAAGGMSIGYTTPSTSTTTGALIVSGGGAFAKELVTGLGLWLVDGQTAPSATSGYAKIYVDTADGDLKVIFGDGTIKTIVTDT